MLKPNFSSITKVEYIEKGNDSIDLAIINKTIKIIPEINSLNGNPLIHESSILNPPLNQKLNNIRRSKAPVINPNCVLALVYFCDLA